MRSFAAGFPISCYIDDYIGSLEHSQVKASFNYLTDLSNELGLPINTDKLSAPTEVINCLDIIIDLADHTLSNPEEKPNKIWQLCGKVSKQKTVSKRALQSLVGNLLYIHKCVHPAQIFVNRVLALLRDNTNSTRIILNKDLSADI